MGMATSSRGVSASRKLVKVSRMQPEVGKGGHAECSWCQTGPVSSSVRECKKLRGPKVLGYWTWHSCWDRRGKKCHGTVLPDACSQ